MPFSFIISAANLSPFSTLSCILLSITFIWLISSANFIDLTIGLVLVLNPLEAETESSNFSSPFEFFKWLVLLFFKSSDRLASSNIYSYTSSSILYFDFCMLSIISSLISDFILDLADLIDASGISSGIDYLIDYFIAEEAAIDYLIDYFMRDYWWADIF